MSYSLPPEIDSLIQQKLATGSYPSEEAVLRAALSALDDHEETVAAVSQGYEDLQAGRYKSLGDADREFRKRHDISREA
jgi:Arc/MetJ-type ribon-helix-helix transcriptional regulator